MTVRRSGTIECFDEIALDMTLYRSMVYRLYGTHRPENITPALGTGLLSLSPSGIDFSSRLSVGAGEGHNGEAPPSA
jgi:hypothetical protein